MRAWPIAAASVAAFLLTGTVAAQAPDDGAREGFPSGEDGDRGAPGPGEGLERPPAEGAEAAPRRVVVILLASAGVDPETADALTELAIGAVATRGHVSIVGKEEFQAQLGHSEARSAECVSSTACLGRVGVHLGVDEIIAGTVARRGNRWVFNINRIDMRSGDLAGRVFREVPGDVGALADAVQAAIPELYTQVADAAQLLVSTNVDGAEVVVDGVLVGVYRGEAVELAEVAPGRHELVVTAAGYFDWTRVVNVAEGAIMQIEATLEVPDDPGQGRGISPLVWIGFGTAAVAGGMAIYFGVSSQQAHESGITRAEAEQFVDTKSTEATIANVSMVVAAAGLGLAIIGLLLSDFGGDEEAMTAFAVPVDGGALLSVRGSLP
ncbi:MAG: PEGA domain-containing protein [Deltaproteobacteria bacterium]|nr:PEGA domain-containing protein [Deltaproteobacteria bacterium]